MKNIASRFIKQHFSFFILLFGGGGLYISNVVLSFYLSPDDYAKYGLLSAYIAIITVFSGFGFDQIILRYSRISEKAVELPVETVGPSILLVVGSSVIFSVLFGLFFWNTHILLLFLCSVTSGVTIYYYTLFRISSHFIAAQVQKNLWKILFPVTLGCAILYVDLEADLTLYAMTFLLLLSSVLGWFQGKTVKVVFFKQGYFDWKLLWGYCSAMLIMNFMTSSDRFFIDGLLGKEELASYFFLQNVFLFPLSQLQNYFGFKDVVTFKKEMSIKLLQEKLRKNMLLSLFACALILTLFASAQLFLPVSDYFKVSRDSGLVALLILTGLVRVWYASLSAAMSVFADSKIINQLNISSCVFLCLGVIFLINIDFATVLPIVIVFLMFWLQRAVAYYLVLRRGLSEV